MELIDENIQHFVNQLDVAYKAWIHGDTTQFRELIASLKTMNKTINNEQLCASIKKYNDLQVKDQRSSTFLSRCGGPS